MGRVKDLLYTGVYDMSYEDDLLRENNILRKNVKDLQEQLNKAHQRIKNITDNTWSEETKGENQMDLKLDDRRD
jgi:uncharacterized protein YlxW (UPF0749 family)|tara:strand:+ start:321 stop:542 length:222 start_codon:yes stop_codon:yes gene_type:complete